MVCSLSPGSPKGLSESILLLGHRKCSDFMSFYLLFCRVTNNSDFINLQFAPRKKHRFLTQLFPLSSACVASGTDPGVILHGSAISIFEPIRQCGRIISTYGQEKQHFSWPSVVASPLGRKSLIHEAPRLNVIHRLDCVWNTEKTSLDCVVYFCFKNWGVLRWGLTRNSFELNERNLTFCSILWNHFSCISLDCME